MGSDRPPTPGSSRLQLCPLCSSTDLSTLNPTGPGPTPLQLQTQNTHFPVPCQASVSCANWQRTPQRPMIHHRVLGEGDGSKGTFSFLKALKGRDLMSPSVPHLLSYPVHPPASPKARQLRCFSLHEAQLEFGCGPHPSPCRCRR